MLTQIARLPFLVVLLGGTGLLSLLPATHATALGDHDVAQAFFYSALILLVLTAMLAIATANRRARNLTHARLAALVWAYLLIPLVMALPMGLAIKDTTWANVWFEMVSSFTTTGASLYAPERLPASVHLWRSIAGWSGGFLTLVAAMSILAPLNLGGEEVISGRLPGQLSRLAARHNEAPEFLFQTALRLFLIYAGLTFLLWLGQLIAGEEGFLALTHAMGTLSTSGISAGMGLSETRAGLAGEILVFVFLLLPLSRRLFPMPEHGKPPLMRDPELRLGVTLIGLAVSVLLLRHLLIEVAADDFDTLPEFLQAFWGGLFTALSFMTTTGYESYWWNSTRDWAGMGAPGMLLLGLAILGGGVATTAGGVKLLRMHAIFLHGRHELEKIVHPSSVVGGGAMNRQLAGQGARAAWIFFMLFTITILLVIASLTLAGESFERAMVLGVAALTSTGQLADVAGNQVIEYAGLSGLVKLILGVTMVLGRLEALALIALFTPQGWKR